MLLKLKGVFFFFFFNQDKGVLIMPLVYCFNTKDASVSLLKQSS